MKHKEIALSYTYGFIQSFKQPNDINDRKETISKLKDLSLEFQFSKTLLWYANALFNLSNNQNDSSNVKKLYLNYKKTYRGASNSQDIALRYANALFKCSNNQILSTVK